MNVANVATPVGASGTVTASAGNTTGSGSAGLGDLFSMQMVQALQNMPASDELAIAPDGLNDEDMEALQELMALMAQMLATGQKLPDELASKMEEKAGAIDQLLQKAQGQFPQITEDWKQLLSKLTNGDPTSEEMEKLTQLLDALKNQKSEQETGKKSTVILRSDLVGNGSTLQQDANKNIQPLRFHQGLSAYKAEAGIPSQSVQPVLQDSGLLNQDSQENGGMPFGTTQGQVTTTNQVQTSQAQQQANVPFHQVHANQLTQQVTQVFVKQMKLTQVNGLHEAKLILNPQSLGQVDVTITSHNGVITAHFSAETQAGKDLLDNQLPQLRAALTQQGLQVDRLEVNQQQEATFGFQQQREQARQQQDHNRKRDEQEDQEFALDALVDNTESTESLWNRLRETARGINDIV
ncbi:flagellar hook-length control protein FliK [Brevibacillus choshinensis]|uniref:Flagellar hook-length control protein FliK n=1 Tax=Brevibacillus choshinensis TaxID=54911 RepID=A0ABX7FH11_BRECH|nr:flagellar hook-length control protein FliK [Brevibacillus choshinensis]QRG65493.1 flagellar hook-length control protein FliK [Brevibacillus choshinensis]